MVVVLLMLNILLQNLLVVLKKKRPTKARERQSIFIRPKKTTSNSNGRHPDADPNDYADGDSSSEWGASSANRATTTTTRPFTRGGAPRARGGPVRAPVRHRARFTVRCVVPFDEIDRECV